MTSVTVPAASFSTRIRTWVPAKAACLTGAAYRLRYLQSALCWRALPASLKLHDQSLDPIGCAETNTLYSALPEPIAIPAVIAGITAAGPQPICAGLSKSGQNRGRKAAAFEATISSLLRQGLKSLKPHNFASLLCFSYPRTAVEARSSSPSVVLLVRLDPAFPARDCSNRRQAAAKLLKQSTLRGPLP
jgi:hypothetical protein